MKKLSQSLLNRFVFVCWVLCSPTLVFAGSTGGDAISQGLSGLIGFLQSTPARLLFVLAIIGIGYSTLHLGKLPKNQAVAYVIGIGLVFGASYVAQQIGWGA